MRFLLSLYGPASGSPHRPPDDDFVAAARTSGELVDAQVVADPSTAVPIPGRPGPSGADGPSRLLAAYYLLDCADDERAAQLAATLPAGPEITLELRPVMVRSGPEPWT
ncbi:YciI family protein [Microlunatus sp. GCM10028923]|uniref:YciI family protein n=1 Tax=Microlunatus sp. GCM10028923 TaxID=3273400 RepID=UPI003620F5FA